MQVWDDAATSIQRVLLGSVGSDFGLQINNASGTEVFGLYGATANLAGWIIKTTSLADNTTDADAGIFLDSTTPQIRVGPTTGEYITINGGATPYIQSSNYSSSALLPKGFKFDYDGTINAVDGIFRGKLQTNVFVSNEVNIMNGDLAITTGSKLATNVTTASLTMTVEDSVFAVNDVFKIGTGSELLVITGIGSAPTYDIDNIDKLGNGTDNPYNGKDVAYKVGDWVNGVKHGIIELQGSSNNILFVQSEGTGTSTLNYNTRIQIGDLGSNEYGLKGWNAANELVFQLGETNNLVGGWTINSSTLANGTNIVLDSNNKAIFINDTTFGNTGIQLEYNSGTPRAFIGTSGGPYLQYSGGTLTVEGTINATAGNFDGTVTVGTDTNKITMIGTATEATTAIYAGAGNYGNADTGFYMDASGRFSLEDQLTWDGVTLSLGPETSLDWQSVQNAGQPATTDYIFFDGVNDYVVVADDPNLNFGSSSDFSIAVWFRTTTTSISRLVEKGSVTGVGKRYEFKVLSNGTLKWELSDGATAKSGESTSVVNDDVWHLGVVTFDRDGNAQIYIDGSADGSAVDISAVLDIDDAAEPLTFGIRSQNESSNPFDGDISDVLIYNRVLAPKEIEQMALGYPVPKPLIIGANSDFRDSSGIGFYTGTGATIAHDSATGNPLGSMKVTATGGSGRAQVDLTVISGHRYKFEFDYKNTASDIADYRIYDLTNAADIVARTNLADNTSWASAADIDFIAPAGCASIRLYLGCASDTDICWFDNVYLTDLDTLVTFPLEVDKWGKAQLVTAWTNQDFNTFVTSGVDISDAQSGAAADSCFAAITPVLGETNTVEFNLTMALGNASDIELRVAGLSSLNAAISFQQTLTSGHNSFVLPAAVGTDVYIGFYALAGATDFAVTNWKMNEGAVAQYDKRGMDSVNDNWFDVSDNKLNGDVNGATFVFEPEIVGESSNFTHIDSYLVSSPTIIGGTQGGARVELTSAGLKAYDSNPTQRALISNDGSGWLGASSTFTWTDAGIVTAGG